MSPEPLAYKCNNYSWPEYFKRQVSWLKKYDIADCEGGASRRDKLGIRCRQDADIFAVGILGASVRSKPAAGVVSRGATSRRYTVPPGRGGFNPAADGEAVGIQNYGAC